jgi:hypothetical protein
MTPKISMLRILSYLLVLLLAWPCFGQSAGLDQKLAASVHGYAITADSLAEGLLQAADRFKIPMGIEWISCPSTRARLHVSWGDTTVREILQKLTETYPGYEMKIGNGVVHIVATTVSPNENFVLLRIKSFNIKDELAESARQKLRDFVRTSVVLPKPGGGGVAGSLISNVGERKIDVSVVNATVEDVLDALATNSSMKVWIVTFAENGALTPTGFRRTQGLHDSAPISDEEQPVWQTFRWDSSTG